VVGRAAAHPGTATAVALVLVLMVVAAAAALTACRFGLAVGATALAMVAALGAVAAVRYPRLPTGATVAEAAADPATLRLLGWPALLLPLLVAVQVANWRTFRRSAPRYW
jgi:cytochrome bd-type quinol oxidase subunit 2